MVGSTLVGPPPPVEMSKKQVMRVSTQDVHRERPSLHHSTTSPAASPDRTKTFKTDHAPKISEDSTIPFSPPTPISPPTAQPPQPEAGPSQPPLAQARPIPPPPNPRKHRSGVLMSRVRANSSAPAFQTGFQMTASKSWGDLSVMGVTRACPTQDIQADGPGRPRERTGPQEGGKRIFSDGSRRGSDELDDSLWDNR